MFLLFYYYIHTLFSTIYINKFKKGKQDKILTKKLGEHCWICNIYVRIEQFDNPIWQKG